LVAAFAPFALYGPAFGITSTIPNVDVAAPGTLTADALAAAVTSVGATIVFASPAALLNVNNTANGRHSVFSTLRLVLSAGAPVPIATLRATAALCPNAELHTPYGMTECLPVADIDLTAIDAAGAGNGVCVGQPVPGVSVLIAPLGLDADRALEPVPAGTTGEVVVRAPWVSDGYNQLWRTEHEARPRTSDGRVWHRSGDVGHIDAQGRLWIEGRSVHVIHADGNPITPVPIEVAVEALDGIAKVAAVGVGPAGCQQLVVVVQDAQRPIGLADEVLVERVRAAVPHAVAAVITVHTLPVDIRHNTKIDRTAVAVWASEILAGRRARCPW
jgi:acyl-coenzyme A synthetase/AMP-(fatty) acid ligase